MEEEVVLSVDVEDVIVDVVILAAARSISIGISNPPPRRRTAVRRRAAARRIPAPTRRILPPAAGAADNTKFNLNLI